MALTGNHKKTELGFPVNLFLNCNGWNIFKINCRVCSPVLKLAALKQIVGESNGQSSVKNV
jgi:hypothetical protein